MGSKGGFGWSSTLCDQRAYGWWIITATWTIRPNDAGGIRFYLNSTLPAGRIRERFRMRSG